MKHWRHLIALGLTLGAVAGLKLLGDAHVSSASWWIAAAALGGLLGVLLAIAVRAWGYAYMLAFVLTMIALGLAHIWPFHSEWGWPLPVLMFAITVIAPAAITCGVTILFSAHGRRSSS